MTDSPTSSTEPTTPVPAGFGPIFRTSPVLEALGNFYSRGSGQGLEIGLLVSERHANGRGLLHGGVAATLADIGMGYLLAYSSDPPSKRVTVSLTLDYIGSAAIGDWVEVRLESIEKTGRMAFVGGALRVDERVIARIRAVFAAPA